MGKIICLMGKSASGKDTLYHQVLADKTLGLRRVVSYTTRPIRAGEENGQAYYFCNEAELERQRQAGRVIEERMYRTVAGPWHYFTLADEQIDLTNGWYLLIATPQMVGSLRRFYGEQAVLAILVDLDDGERLSRALAREKRQERPNYAEVCRRFLADEEDFAPSVLAELAPIHRVVHENTDDCVKQIEDYIRSVL